MQYNTEKLGKYVEILSGFAFKSKDFSTSGIPVIKIKNICPPEVSLNDVSYVPKHFLETHSKYILERNDILIAMTGSHINQWASVVGRVARVKYEEESLLNQRVGKIVVIDTEKCDENFVYYYLSQDSVKIELANIAGGAANQANISPADIKGLKIPFPSIDVQRRIGKILSTYDDLIENNKEQIKLLEEMAQRLYKEWFVDLHFPGYEDVEIVDGVPEGWRKNRADSFFKITIGKTSPRTETQCFLSGNQGTKWVSISDMGKSDMFVFNTSESLTDEAVKKYNVKIVPKGTVLVSFKLTIGRISITTDNMCTNEAIAHFYIDDDRYREYTYMYLKMFKYEVLGNTSSISKAINSKIIKSMPFIMPDDKTLMLFSDKIEDIMNCVYIKQQMNNRLIESRNRMMSKLMSGNVNL